jgi:hypothetical protein
VSCGNTTPLDIWITTIDRYPDCVMIMSMGWDCLWTAATDEPIVIFLVDIWHAEPCWNDIDRGNFLNHPSVYPGNPTRSNLVVKHRNSRKKRILPHETSLSYSKGSLTCRIILWHEAEGFSFPPKEGALRIFIAFKNPSQSAGFEPAKLESNGKHANDCTTKDESRIAQFGLYSLNQS